MTTRQIAHGIAQLGRNGDSTLVHMQPHEVAGLQALAKANGTSMTINPETGLPEAFSLGGFFSSLLPVFAGAATGGAGAPLWAGIAAGAATGAVTSKDPLKGAIMGGLGGYGGYNIGSGFAGAGASAAPTGGIQLAPNTVNGVAAVPTGSGVQISNQALDQALRTTGANFDPLAVEGANRAFSAATPGVQFSQGAANTILPGDAGYIGQGFSGKEALMSGSIGSPTPGGALPYGDQLSKSLSNAGDLFSGKEGAWDSFRQGLAGAGKPMVSNLSAATTLGMPLGGAILSGLEPSDIYGTPVKVDRSKEKYDPYATLNLSGDTGLRLYAAGGPVSFASGGDSNKELSLDPAGLPGGGSEAMQGAGMLPLDVADINAKYGLGSADKMGAYSPVPVPKLGLFASNDQIESARTAYEQQLKAAMSGRGGMGSFPGMGRMTGIGGLNEVNKAQQTAQSGSGPAVQVTTAFKNTAPTASTANTAETALSRLNLNKQYANGGTIQAGGLQDLYGRQDDATTGPMLSREGYGLGRLQAMADGGVPSYAKGGYLDGPGDGMSDSIPATIEGQQPARLADGEFVVPADVVSHLGNGSTKAGSQRLYSMLDKVRKARTGTTKQGKKINPAKYMPA